MDVFELKTLGSTQEDLKLRLGASSVRFNFTVTLCRLSCGNGRAMNRTLGPILKTILFTIVVPGTVAGLVPYWILDGSRSLTEGPLEWLGAICFLLGASIYFRCAWEFAVRGMGTPAPIAPTKYLVTTGLHRYIRNPMYIGVFLVILGEAAGCRSLHLVEYAAAMLLTAHLFILFYEEPTLMRQFGKSYEDYKRRVPRWIPRLPPH